MVDWLYPDSKEAFQHYKKFTLTNIWVIKYSFTLKDNVENRGKSKKDSTITRASKLSDILVNIQG